MEAKYNDIGYNALKLLDKSGHLQFELSYVLPKFVIMLLFMWYIRALVEDLLQVLALDTSLTARKLMHSPVVTDFPHHTVDLQCQHWR